jgi:hypothetical protein
VSLVKAWEEDIQVPTQEQWKAFAGLLNIPNIAIASNGPTRE